MGSLWTVVSEPPVSTSGLPVIRIESMPSTENFLLADFPLPIRPNFP